MTHMATVTAQ